MDSVSVTVRSNTYSNLAATLMITELKAATFLSSLWASSFYYSFAHLFSTAFPPWRNRRRQTLSHLAVSPFSLPLISTVYLHFVNRSAGRVPLYSSMSHTEDCRNLNPNTSCLHRLSAIERFCCVSSPSLLPLSYCQRGSATEQQPCHYRDAWMQGSTL